MAEIQHPSVALSEGTVSDELLLEHRLLLKEEGVLLKRKLYEQYGEQIQTEWERIQREKEDNERLTAVISRKELVSEILKGNPIRKEIQTLQEEIIAKLAETAAQLSGKNSHVYECGSRLQMLLQLSQDLGHSAAVIP
jgi:hypothetical protein